MLRQPRRSDKLGDRLVSQPGQDLGTEHRWFGALALSGRARGLIFALPML
jgi:hypothetical protein